MYIFIPNDFGKEFFKIQKDEFIGEGITQLIQTAIGKKNYVPAQDPIRGDQPGEGVVYTNEGIVFGKIIRL